MFGSREKRRRVVFFSFGIVKERRRRTEGKEHDRRGLTTSDLRLMQMARIQPANLHESGVLMTSPPPAQIITYNNL